MIQPHETKKSYAAAWLLIGTGAVLTASWVFCGRALVRRAFYAAAPIPARFRTSSEFVAVLLPRVSERERESAVTAAELRALLEGLQKEGYTSVGLEDVAAFYAGKTRLPPKAMLLAFAQDDDAGASAADAVLRRLRLRAVDFVRGIASPSDEDTRRFLTRHAIVQMRRSGSWEFGWVPEKSAPPASFPAPLKAVLEMEGVPARAVGGARLLRFTASEVGYNDASDHPKALHILALRPDRREENLAIIRASWPRSREFVDDFSRAGLGADWIAGWGAVSLGAGRLALLPTPRQTGAAVFLRGTEAWRDVVLEFQLKRYRKEFWAYVRYGEGRFLRVGARDGYWYVEQKIGPNNLPSMLARAPIVEDGLPARVRLVLKGGSAIVHVNDRMQFGKALRVHPAVARGRVLLGVYDLQTRSAFALLTSVRAVPVHDVWIAANGSGRAEFDEDRLAELRGEAVYARAISPRWVDVAPDGRVSVLETQGPLVRSLAGFFSCRLVPMADLSAASPALGSAAGSERMLAGFGEAVRQLDAAGLNVRLNAAELGRPGLSRFLSKLREDLHAGHRELWVTLDGGHENRDVAGVDGVLRPAMRKAGSFELLEAQR